jgi:peptide/nickel transport system permease protein
VATFQDPAARHILPGVVGPLCVSGTLLAATAILLESSLSFLGFGIAPPTATWGGLLNEAQSLTVLESMPWMWIPPGALIALTVLSINFIGDGLRDALDPRLNQLTR